MIFVTNRNQGGVGEYIGRGSPLGNPFSHLARSSALYFVATREEAILNYRTWFKQKIKEDDPVIMKELNRFIEIAKKRDLYLKCNCKPKSCHGDIIKEYIEDVLGENPDMRLNFDN
jgi:hypothetical protein